MFQQNVNNVKIPSLETGEFFCQQHLLREAKISFINMHLFASSNAGIVSSNLTHNMDVCACIYSAFMLPCVLGSGLETG
jgi:hypothetical protein